MKGGHAFVHMPMQTSMPTFTMKEGSASSLSRAPGTAHSGPHTPTLSSRYLAAT